MINKREPEEFAKSGQQEQTNDDTRGRDRQRRA